MGIYLLLFLITFGIAVLFTFLMIKLSWKFKVLDWPSDNKRKLHEKPVPLLGGQAIFLSFFLVVFVYFSFFAVNAKNIDMRHLVGLLVSGLIIMIIGLVEDKYGLSAKKRLFLYGTTIMILLFFGVAIKQITNPLGGIIDLNLAHLDLKIGEKTVVFNYLSLGLTFFWVYLCMMTTKLYDGLDGFIGGLTVIGSLMVFLLSLTQKYYQPDIAMLALILGAACLGFLIFNFYPAKIFLGEGGSVLTGFLLGTLSIISGSKIATALLVLGIPLLDLVWVVLRRIVRRKSPFSADHLHIHHRLLQAGLSTRQAVLILYFLSFSFGITTLFLQSKQKLYVLGIMTVLMLILGISLVYLLKKNKHDI